MVAEAGAAREATVPWPNLGTSGPCQQGKRKQAWGKGKTEATGYGKRLDDGGGGAALQRGAGVSRNSGGRGRG